MSSAVLIPVAVEPTQKSPVSLPDTRVHPEDIFLYAFALLLLAVIAFALLRSERIIADKLVLQGVPAVEKADLGRSYLLAQVDLSVRRYQQANGALLARTARINGAFLLGASMLLLGCLLVVRRVRDVPITTKIDSPGKATMELVTSSPGTYMSFLGAVIIVVCLLTVGQVATNDNGIAFPPVGASVEVPNDPVVDASNIGSALKNIPVK